ncbi:MAG: DUF4129 domain-containing protein [Planctomycetes bacterium]|nr:DUF4129 domain-containing protein [Planctomycetota bacterium]
MSGAETLAWPRRIESIALVACTLLALANLPAPELPSAWVVAFSLPAAILGRLPRTSRTWIRVATAIALQTTACLLAMQTTGGPTRPAALACTILPPLAFVTSRQRDADPALALFLGFCVLLVGTILDGVNVPLTVAYGTAACLALRCSTHLAAATLTRRTGPAAARTSRTALPLSAIALVLPCTAAAVLVDRTIEILPSPRLGPQSSRVQDGGLARRSVGLDDSFILGAGGGVLSGLSGEQLVRVHATTDAAVPSDLYLRSGFFASPGLDRWELGAVDAKPAPNGGRCVLRPADPALPLSWLEVERFSGANNFVFVPPGTSFVRGIGNLVIDSPREWIRQTHGSALDLYEVAFQRQHDLRDDAAPVANARRLGLLSLPAGLDRPRFETLLAQWNVGDAASQATAAVAAGLASRCRYDRIDPVGPFGHAIENFLFADHDRRGYCMHFATAAALMLRMRGIPCRIGVGLYGGDPDRTNARARLYGSQHAHAWVEIATDDGYVVFDPTPPPERGARMPSRQDPSRFAGRAGGQDDGPGFFAALAAFVAQPWVLAVVAAFAFAAWSARQNQRVGAAPRPAAPARSARRLLGRLLAALDTVGHRRRRGETLESFLRSLAGQQRLLPEVQDAVIAYQEIRFGDRPFDDARERRLLRAVDAAAAMTPLAPASRSEPNPG